MGRSIEKWGIIIGALSQILPMTWYVRGGILVVVVGFTCSLIWHSKLGKQYPEPIRIVVCLYFIYGILIIAWKPLHTEYLKTSEPLNLEPSLSHARIEIANIVAVPASDRNRYFFMNIFYENIGKLPARGIKHRSVRVLSDKRLTKEAEEENHAIANALPYDQLPSDPGELPSGRSAKKYFSLPNKPEPSAYELTKEYENIVAGRKYLYLFVTFKYRDRSMPSNVRGVTEFCGWFIETFEIWRNCGRNRAYLEKIE